MKKHMKIIAYRKSVWMIVLITIATVISCNDSFLNGPKPQGPTEEDFFKTEGDFEKTVYGIYAKMNAWYAWNGGVQGVSGGNSPNFTVWTLPGDDATTTAGSEYGATESFRPLQASNSVLERFYNASYELVFRANVLLEAQEEEQGVYQSPTLKNAHRGEALFLRAYAFFNLWNYFGKAPIVLKRIRNTSEQAVPPSEGTQLLDQAIIDLQEAATLLPDSWDENNLGRVTKNSANGMLGKILVFRGTVNKTTADFTAAIQAFNKITGVALVADFGDNHAFDTENNEESLFEYQASQPSFDNQWLPDESNTTDGSMSTASYVAYENINNFGYGGARTVATQKLVNIFDPADPRLAVTVNPGNRFVQKYVVRDRKNQVSGSSVNNPRILRYGDVLLLKAEAIVRSNGSMAEAIGLINQVRQRARNMNGGSVPADLNIGESNVGTIKQWIMDERFRELAFEEGHRWWDLRRWAMAEEITLDKAFFDSVNPNFSFEYPKHLYYPIPLSELNRNRLMKQNSGY
jgi:tetratricopeptide (TPR) repeat protein